MKDLIIVRGQKHYPQDIEWTVTQVPGVRTGCCAAFAINNGGEDELVIVADLNEKRIVSDVRQFAAMIQTIISSVVENHGIKPYDVVLTASGTVPKTTSGKVQRRACHDLYVASRLGKLSLRGDLGGAMPSLGEAEVGTNKNIVSVQNEVVAWVTKTIREKTKAPASLQLSPTRKFSELGLDSLGLVELLASVSRQFDVTLADAVVSQLPTVDALAWYIASQVINGQGSASQQLSLVQTLADFKEVAGPHLFKRCEQFGRWVEQRNEQRSWTSFRTVESRQGLQVSVRTARGEVHRGILFGYQDYLGLNDHPHVRNSVADALERFGPHSAGADANLGNNDLSDRLRAELSNFLCRPEVVLFPTGWATAYSTLRALVREADYVVLDMLSHNCIVSGARAATTNIAFFGHNSSESLDHVLRSIRAKDTENAVLVVTESLFSMDADGPELRKMIAICRDHDAFLMVDVAHDLGALGPNGTGRMGQQGVLSEIDLIMGTFSKTLVANGGFLALNDHSVGTFIRVFGDANTFSNAQGPLQSAAALAALQIVRSREGEALRQGLLSASTRMRGALIQEGLRCLGEPCAIIPVITGDERVGRQACMSASAAGVITNFIEFPGVARGESRLRIQISPAHHDLDLERYAHIIGEAIREAKSDLQRRADVAVA